MDRDGLHMVGTAGTILASLAALDSAYLYVFAEENKNMIQSVQGGKPFRSERTRTSRVWIHIIVIYFLLTASVYALVTECVDNVTSATLAGSVLGAVVYGVYNCTNAVAFEAYPERLVIRDTLWGTLMLGGVSAIAFAVDDAL